MHRLVLLLALLVALAAGLFVLLDRDDEPREVPASLGPPAPTPAATAQAPAAELAPAERDAPLATEPSATGDGLVPPPPSLGSGRGVIGRVTDADGLPVEGATVTARFVRGSYTGRGYSTNTDASGRYRLDVDLSEWETEETRFGRDEARELLQRQRQLLRDLASGDRDEEQGQLARRYAALSSELQDAFASYVEPPTVRVDARHRRHGAAQRTEHLPRDRARRLVVDLALTGGAGVSGRVLHLADGVPGARVHLFDADWRLVSSTVADREGRYSLAVLAPGSYTFHARMDGVGAGGTTAFTLGAGVFEPVVDIDLAGDGALRGHVALPDGTDVVGLKVAALQLGLEQAGAVLQAQPSLAAIARAEATGGLCASEAVTDADGNFELLGLQRARFVLRFPGVADPELQPEGDHMADGRDVPIELGAHLLRVTLKCPPELAPFVRVRCTKLADAPDATAGDAFAVPTDLRAATVSFLVEPGQTYRLALSGAGVEPQEQELRVPVGRAVTDLTLRPGFVEQQRARRRGGEVADAPEHPAPIARGGTLRLELRDEGQRPIAGGRVVLRPAGGGAPLVRELEGGAAHYDLALAAGQYEVFVEPLDPERPWLLPARADEPALVSPRATERATVRFARGGRLWVRAPAGPDAPSWVKVVAVNEADGAAAALRFRAGGQETFDGLSGGREGFAHPVLPAGRWSVWLEGVGYERRGWHVEIVAGEDTTLDARE